MSAPGKKSAANAATIADLRSEVGAMTKELIYLCALERAGGRADRGESLVTLLGIASDMSAGLDEIESRTVAA